MTINRRHRLTVTLNRRNQRTNGTRVLRPNGVHHYHHVLLNQIGDNDGFSAQRADDFNRLGRRANLNRVTTLRVGHLLCRLSRFPNTVQNGTANNSGNPTNELNIVRGAFKRNPFRNRKLPNNLNSHLPILGGVTPHHQLGHQAATNARATRRRIRLGTYNLHLLGRHLNSKQGTPTPKTREIRRVRRTHYRVEPQRLCNGYNRSNTTNCTP